MKNNLSLLLSFVILISGCTQEELRNSQPDFLDGRTFTASFEQDHTRTYVEDGNLLRWTAGDQISLFDGNTLNRQYKFDGETGDNSGTFSIVSKPFGTGNALSTNYAVYPYSSEVKITETGVITATLPAEQSYAYDSFGLGANTMVAVTKDIDDTFLKFKNVCGYLKIRLYGDDIMVKSISLTGNNNEGLAGKASITPAYGDEPKVVMFDEATSSITLNCGEGIKIGSTAETATAFWIAVPPTAFERGFEITVADISGKTFTKSTSNEITVERNVIKPMKAFEVEMESVADWEDGTIPNNQIWYTSSDGNLVTPNSQAVFGVNIESNVYVDGKGIITFDGEVTKIGPLSFAGCYNLKSVTIPSSITTIENAAFISCPNLSEFKGEYASDGGRCLINDNAIIAYADASGTEYTIPDNVTTVLSGAFGVCYTLSKITIPEKVTTIQPLAFLCPNLNTINGKYATEDGRFYIVDGSIKIFAPYGLTECAIPNSVTTIEYNALATANFTSVTIPDSVTSIEDGAFYACSNLKDIYCKATTPPIAVFNGNSWDPFVRDATIYVPIETIYEYRKAAGWKKYGDRIVAFDYERNETVIADNIIYYTSDNGKIIEPYNADDFGAKIISNTYDNGQGAIVFDKDVISIGYQAFHNCYNLTSITIPDSVVEVVPGAFYNCCNLKEFKGCHASDDGHCLVIDGVLAAYAMASGKEYTIPNNVTEIGGCVFEKFYDLTHIDIPDGITKIGDSAFQSCSSLTSIIIPNSVTYVGSQAFLYCYDLTDVTIGDSVKSIGQYAFRYCPILNLTIPDSVDTIHRGAFYGCSELTNINIGNGVKEIWDEAFAHCYSLTNVTIPQSVTKIYNEAFYNCHNLVNIFCTPIVPPTSSYWYGEYEWEAFDLNASYRKIYVPRNSAEAYKSAEGWSNYASDIVGYDF